MATVHTAYGPGEIVETQTTRGRTEYRVAGRDFNIWLDETKLERTADAFGAPISGESSGYGGGSGAYFGRDPMDNQVKDRRDIHPSDAYGDLSKPYPEDTAYDEQSHWDQDPAYQEHMFGQGNFAGPSQSQFADPDMHANDSYVDYNDHVGYRQAWAPMDNDNSVNLPYDPTPQYPAIPGDTESTLQPIHEIDADERLSPADSISFDRRSDDESEIDGHSDNFARAAGQHRAPDGGRHRPGPDYDPRVPPGGFQVYEGTDYLDRPEEPAAPVSHRAAIGDPVPHQTGPYGLGPNDPELQEYAHPSMRHDDDGSDPNLYQDWLASGGWEGQGHQGSRREAILPLLIPLAEGLAAGGAEAGAAGAAGAAEGGAMAGEAGGGMASGLGNLAGGAMGGGGDDDSGQPGYAAGGGQGGPDKIDELLDKTAPGQGWGYSQRGASVDDWLASQDQGSGRYAGLSDKYIDITADADYHNDPIAQFRHDPIAYISRIGHVLDEPVSPEMEHYGNLVEANVNIREAAWKDVRQKAMRLRREGAVQVKDISPDRIYATVQGDHGTYDTMIVKGGAFGGYGGGHTITNWRCSCEWGRWAFKRQFTYVGRLCSHGYASYMEMNSNHMKGQPRQRKLTRPYTKRADALQNGPERLVPEMVINDSDDARQFLDVTEDERKDTGPDDIVSDKDIVHFAQVMSYCDTNRVPYPRKLVAFLERYADDQTKEDWKVTDTGKAESALNEIRDWSERPVDESWGNMEERNDDIRDAVDEAREKGVDASQLVAFRTATPTPRDTDPKTPGVQTKPGWSFDTPLISGNPDTDSGPMLSPGVDQSGTHRSPASPNAKPATPAGEPAPGSPSVGPHGAPGQAGRGGPDGGGGAYGPGASTGDWGTNPSGSGVSGGGKSTGDWGTNPSGAGVPGGAPKAPGASDDTANGAAPGGAPGAGGSGGAGANWQNLYDMNKSVVGGDPNLIQPGQHLDTGNGHSYDVKSGDTLSGIASDPSKMGGGGDAQSLGTGLSGGTGASGSGGLGDTLGGGASGGVATDAVSPAGNAGSGGAMGPAATPPPAAPPVTPPSSATNKTVASVFSDQDDYNEWQRLAYPDGPMKSYNHQPFNGSGGDVSIPFGTSEEYADKARKDADDVTDLEHHNVNESQAGIKRAGKGARRHVEPTVVREQRPTRGGHRQTAEAPMETYASFDPLAARSPEDFNDDEAGMHIAANTDEDIVTAFHRSAGAQAVMGSGGSGGREEFDIAGAAGQFLQRTAGRNFSLAEQHELIREGDIGGAGNLDSLDLRNTHYSENSVGLFT